MTEYQAVAGAYEGHSFDDKKDEIKWVWTEPFENAFPNLEHHHLKPELSHKDVLVLCNHCDEPPCTRVCPTEATWKRESDGIVMMDWHRCIGCRFCIAACPYGSRSFNWRDPRPHIPGEMNPEYPTRQRGVVEKCTFCVQRINRAKLDAKDEGRHVQDGEIQTACMQTCPTQWWTRYRWSTAAAVAVR